MTAGRPRMPSEAKLLAGTYRADRDGPIPTGGFDGVPNPPSHLKGEALAFWKKHVPELIEKGVAKAIDSAQLAIMCECWARYRRLSRLFDSLKNTDRRLGSIMISLGVATDKFDKIASRFGFTPSDRAKLHVSGQPKKPTVSSRDRNAGDQPCPTLDNSTP